MIKKITVTAVVFLLTILVFNSCQSSGLAQGVDKKSSKKGFRAVLSAEDVEGTLDFLESDVSLVETDAYGETPLFTAARYGHIDLIALLLLKGADPKVANDFGEHPVHVAAANGKKDTAAMLEAQGDCMDGCERWFRYDPFR